MTEKVEILAIHDDDIKKVLSDFDIEKKIDNREASCCVCGTLVTWENLNGVLINEGKIYFVCDTNNCIDNISTISL